MTTEEARSAWRDDSGALPDTMSAEHASVPEANPVQGARLEAANQLHRFRLPGFVSDQEIGLGDVIKHATSTMGIRPCRGCEQRAAWLNQRFVISPWKRR